MDQWACEALNLLPLQLVRRLVRHLHEECRMFYEGLNVIHLPQILQVCIIQPLHLDLRHRCKPYRHGHE